MSEEYNAEFIAGYGDGVLHLRKEIKTPEYIAGYEMGMRLRERKEHPQQQQSMQAPFEIPGTHQDYINGFRVGKSDAKNIGLPRYPTKNTVYDDGYEIGFGSVDIKITNKAELDKIMERALNPDVAEVYTSWIYDELPPSPPPPSSNGTPKNTKRSRSSLPSPSPSSNGTPKNTKRSRSSLGNSKKIKPGGGKSKRIGGKTKKRNQKK